MRDLNTSAPDTMRSAQKDAGDALAKIQQQAEAHFLSAPGSHDWEHTLRVHRICLRIGPKEGADMFAIEAAAYLHDIGRSVQDNSNGSVCHAAIGADMAAALMEGLGLEDVRQRNIVHCIRSHRFRDNHPPESIEARILFDADKLDAIGAVGVARAYLFAGELGACLHNPYLPVEQARSYSRDDTGYREYVLKLSKVRHRMLTLEGRRMAEERHAFMELFFKRFLDEYDGKC
jgi:uncharacterized protein